MAPYLFVPFPNSIYDLEVLLIVLHNISSLKHYFLILFQIKFMNLGSLLHSSTALRRHTLCTVGLVLIAYIV